MINTGINVLSLFDGISCTQIALKNLGIKVNKYYASEIDKPAITITQKNFPNTIQLGDIKNIKGKDLPKITLIAGGSPCQGFSFAGKQLAFDDPRSALFFEFIRMLKEVKPKYFLLENVRMEKKHIQVINETISKIYPDSCNSNLFGEIEPILINSALLSAQNRNRLYWTNIPGIKQPKDLGIILRDVLEYEPEKFTKMSDSFLKRNGKRNCMIDDTKEKAHSFSAMDYVKNGRQGNYLACNNEGKPKVDKKKPNQINPSKKASGKQPYMQDRVFHIDGKSHALTREFASRTNVGTKNNGMTLVPLNIKGGAIRGRYNDEGKTDQHLEVRKDAKSNAITTVEKDNIALKEEELTWRKLTVLEAERLQTIPDNYTQGVSNSQRYKMLGNGFTVKVIEHILSNMEA